MSLIYYLNYPGVKQDIKCLKKDSDSYPKPTFFYFRKTKLSLDYTNKRLEVVQDGIENLPKFYFLSSEKPVDISRSEDLSVDVKEIDGVRIPAPLGRMLLEWK